MVDLVELPEWRALLAQRDALAGVHLKDLFAAAPGRAEALSVETADLFLDYSKQRLTADTREALIALARARGLSGAIADLFAGEPVNTTENRAAWHVALRAPPEAGYPDEIHTVLKRIAAFVDRLRSGAWRGHTGEAITDVVSIGIGGSELGPRMVCAALASRPADLRVHFAANVDPAELDDCLAGLEPATTLFVVTSKSFTTAETLANARAARDWLFAAGAGRDDIARHFVAVSTNRDAVAEFGIDPDQMFGFWDWVGGRFSLWSAVGLPIALAIGMAGFRELLAGAHAMDEHFRTAPLAENLPVLLGLIGIWNRNLLGYSSQVVVPYAQRLVHLPAWLRQVEMESNGKSVTRDGKPVPVATVPSVWGDVGTNAQHAFFQMLHQGTDILPVDFILPLAGEGERHEQRVANALAQAEALMQGREAASLRDDGVPEALITHRRFEGNRPSSMLLLPAVEPRSLGALLAAYEHKVFVQGVIWGINSFDQWGVELGKGLAKRILGELQDSSADPWDHDASTAMLLERVRHRIG